MKKSLYLAAGFLSIVLGIIGAILPVMPTAPFILLASWCFAQSSPRFHAYLRNHPRFGHYVRNWEDRRAMPRRAKWLATVMVSISLTAASIMFGKAWWFVTVPTVMLCAAVFIWIWRLPEA